MFHPLRAFLLLLVSSWFFVLSACSRGNAQVDPRTLAPLVRTAMVGDAPRATNRFTGVISARVQSDLGFRVPGKIVERRVDTGQRVRRGQTLMRIDRTDYALAMAASTATVAAARARAVQTSSDEQRYRDLVSAGAVSALTYDQAKAAADAAQAQLEAAQAQVAVAQNEAGYSVLLADADGIVVQTLAEPGQVVAAGQTVVRLAHAGPREAAVSLPETLAPNLGSTARATLFNSGFECSAKLRQLSNAADPQTRTFEARYVLDGCAADTPLGTTITIAIPDTRIAGALQVPLGSIYDSGKGPGVWLVDGSTSRVSWRPIKLASVDGENASVVSGLNPGDRFVALGAHQLHQDETIRSAPTAGMAE